MCDTSCVQGRAIGAIPQGPVLCLLSSSVEIVLCLVPYRVTADRDWLALAQNLGLHGNI